MGFFCCFKHNLKTKLSQIQSILIFLCPIISFLVKSTITLLILIATKLYFTKEIKPDLENTEDETYFYTSSKREKNKRQKFPSLLEDEQMNSSEIMYSIVIPAYNEEDRMRTCLDEILEFFESKRKQGVQNTNFEIIVCNDGSKDKTSQIALAYTDKIGHDVNGLRLLELSKNRGKGGAVRKGVLASRGEYILMCDADGATKFSEIEKLITCMVSNTLNGKFGRCVVGSRHHLAEDSIAKRTFFRTILMKGFHFFVKYIGNVHSIHDTQCGFKLFNKTAAKFLFSNLHIERWAFDVELLYTCEEHGIGLGEVLVQWEEIDGSKLTPLTAAVQMARDLLYLRLYYIFGVYKFCYKYV